MDTEVTTATLGNLSVNGSANGTVPQMSAYFLFILLIVSFIGNVLVMIAIWRSVIMQRMFYYVSISLALSDITATVLVWPVPVLYHVLADYGLPQGVCPSWLVIDTLLLASSLTHVCMLAYNTQRSLLHPLNYRLSQSPLSVALQCGLAWVTAAILAIPILALILTQQIGVHHDISYQQCILSVQSMDFYLAKYIPAFILPVCVAIGLICWVVTSSRRHKRVLGRIANVVNQHGIICSGTAIMAAGIGGTSGSADTSNAAADVAMTKQRRSRKQTGRWRNTKDDSNKINVQAEIHSSDGSSSPDSASRDIRDFDDESMGNADNDSVCRSISSSGSWSGFDPSDKESCENAGNVGNGDIAIDVENTNTNISESKTETLPDTTLEDHDSEEKSIKDPQHSKDTSNTESECVCNTESCTCHMNIDGGLAVVSPEEDCGTGDDNDHKADITGCYFGNNENQNDNNDHENITASDEEIQNPLCSHDEDTQAQPELEEAGSHNIDHQLSRYQTKEDLTEVAQNDIGTLSNMDPMDETPYVTADSDTTVPHINTSIINPTTDTNLMKESASRIPTPDIETSYEDTDTLPPPTPPPNAHYDPCMEDDVSGLGLLLPPPPDTRLDSEANNRLIQTICTESGTETEQNKLANGSHRRSITRQASVHSMELDNNVEPTEGNMEATIADPQDVNVSVAEKEELLEKAQTTPENGFVNAGFENESSVKDENLLQGPDGVNCIGVDGIIVRGPSVTSKVSEGTEPVDKSGLYTKCDSMESTENGEGECKIPKQRRSILKRENSKRNSQRKSVKFASDVSEPKQKGRGSKLIRRGTKHVKATHPDQAKRPIKASQTLSNLSMHDDSLKAIKRPLSPEASSSLEYLTKINSVQGERASKRLKRDQNTVRLVMALLSCIVLLTLPSIVVSGLAITGSAVEPVLEEALQLVMYSVTIIIPLAFMVIKADIRENVAGVICCLPLTYGNTSTETQTDMTSNGSLHNDPEGGSVNGVTPIANGDSVIAISNRRHRRRRLNSGGSNNKQKKDSDKNQVKNGDSKPMKNGENKNTNSGGKKQTNVVNNKQTKPAQKNAVQNGNRNVANGAKRF